MSAVLLPWWFAAWVDLVASPDAITVIRYSSRIHRAHTIGNIYHIQLPDVAGIVADWWFGSGISIRIIQLRTTPLYLP